MAKKIIRWAVALFFGSTILAVVAYRFIPVYITPLMVIRMAEQARDGRSLTMHHRWVSLGQMSPHIMRAVIAAEDAKFMSHHGFDYEAIEKAAEHNRNSTDGQTLGASTITQQTAKNVFLWPGRTYVRKGLEAYFTFLMETLWGKERIMEVYLNSIETGDGIYGVEAVAREHFGCGAGELTIEQCALIAASLPNPLRHNSAAPDDYLLKRQRKILRGMAFVTDIPGGDR